MNIYRTRGFSLRLAANILPRLFFMLALCISFVVSSLNAAAVAPLAKPSRFLPYRQRIGATRTYVNSLPDNIVNNTRQPYPDAIRNAVLDSVQSLIDDTGASADSSDQAAISSLIDAAHRRVWAATAREDSDISALKAFLKQPTYADKEAYAESLYDDEISMSSGPIQPATKTFFINFLKGLYSDQTGATPRDTAKLASFIKRMQQDIEFDDRLKVLKPGLDDLSSMATKPAATSAGMSVANPAAPAAGTIVVLQILNGENAGKFVTMTADGSLAVGSNDPLMPGNFFVVQQFNGYIGFQTASGSYVQTAASGQPNAGRAVANGTSFANATSTTSQWIMEGTAERASFKSLVMGGYLFAAADKVIRTFDLNLLAPAVKSPLAEFRMMTVSQFQTQLAQGRVRADGDRLVLYMGLVYQATTSDMRAALVKEVVSFVSQKQQAGSWSAVTSNASLMDMLNNLLETFRASDSFKDQAASVAQLQSLIKGGDSASGSATSSSSGASIADQIKALPYTQRIAYLNKAYQATAQSKDDGMKDDYLSSLLSLVDDRGDATPNEITAAKTLINRCIFNIYRTDQVRKPQLEEALKKIEVPVLVDDRLSKLNDMTLLTFDSQAFKDLFMTRLLMLVRTPNISAVDLAKVKEFFNDQVMATIDFRDDWTDLKAKLTALSGELNARQAAAAPAAPKAPALQLPNGALFNLISLNPGLRGIVFVRAGQNNTLKADGTTSTDVTAQFDLIANADGTVSLRNKAGNMLITLDDKGVSLAAATQQPNQNFVVEGTADTLSLKSKAGNLYLSVSGDGSLMGVAVKGTGENFKISQLSPYQVALTQNRQRADIDRINGYTFQLALQVQTSNDRVLLLQDIQSFIEGKRATPDAWSAFKADQNTYPRVINLLDTLSQNGLYSDVVQQIQQVKAGLIAAPQVAVVVPKTYAGRIAVLSDQIGALRNADYTQKSAFADSLQALIDSRSDGSAQDVNALKMLLGRSKANIFRAPDDSDFRSSLDAMMVTITKPVSFDDRLTRLKNTYDIGFESDADSANFTMQLNAFGRDAGTFTPENRQALLDYVKELQDLVSYDDTLTEFTDDLKKLEAAIVKANATAKPVTAPAAAPVAAAQLTYTQRIGDLNNRIRSVSTQEEKFRFLQDLQKLVTDRVQAQNDELDQVQYLLEGAQFMVFQGDAQTLQVLDKEIVRLRQPVSYAERVAPINALFKQGLKTDADKAQFVKMLQDTIALKATFAPAEQASLTNYVQQLQVACRFDPNLASIKQAITDMVAAVQKAPAPVASASPADAKKIDFIPADTTPVAIQAALADGTTGFLRANASQLIGIAADVDALDPSVQFTLARYKDFVGFKNAAGNFIQAPPFGAQNAGRVVLGDNAFATDQATASQFVPENANGAIVLKSVATGGYIGMTADKQLVTIDMQRFSPLAVAVALKTKLISVSGFLQQLANMRTLPLSGKLDAYFTAINTPTNDDDRKSLVREVSQSIEQILQTSDSFNAAINDAMAQDKLTRLLNAYLYNPAYQATSGYFKQLVDFATLEQNNAFLIAPRKGQYWWLLHNTFRLPKAGEAMVSFEVRAASSDVMIAFAKEPTRSTSPNVFYEVVVGASVGGQENMKTILRRGAVGMEVKREQNQNAVIAKAPETYTITLSAGLLRLYKGDVTTTPVAEWQDPSPANDAVLVGIGSKDKPLSIRNIKVSPLPAGAIKVPKTITKGTIAPPSGDIFRLAPADRIIPANVLVG